MTYDPTNPPARGIPANPLPAMFDEGDAEETMEEDSWRPIKPTLRERFKFLRSKGMEVDHD